MLNFSSLYSGSTGNSLFLQSDNSKVLIDTGVSAKKITEALASFNVNVEDLDAIVITHEHSDHVQSLGTLSKNTIFLFMQQKKLLMQCLNKQKK